MAYNEEYGRYVGIVEETLTALLPEGGDVCPQDGSIPQHLREYANLTKDVAFIGASRRAEIWDAASWKKFNSALTEDAIAEAMDELDL